MHTHQLLEFVDKSVLTYPIDSLVHHVFDFHDRPPLLDFACTREIHPRFPRRLALYNGSSPVIPANDPPEVERALWRLGPIGRLGGASGVHVNGPLPTPLARAHAVCSKYLRKC